MGPSRARRQVDVETNHRTRANNTVEVERLALNGCVFWFVTSVGRRSEKNLGLRFRCGNARVLACEPTRFGCSIVSQLRIRSVYDGLEALAPFDFSELDFGRLARGTIGTDALSDDGRNHKANRHCDSSA